ncbi:hypothetical protein [Streptomyces fradiae]|uniref:hypothetical protein n=1 Tax=Streptomyces fradiae TaxID=1906 RepID=UPI00201852C9|nr:hypothetical protein [Streptomyces fradiae]
MTNSVGTSAALRPTAGALRLVEPSTATPTSVDVSAYVRQMTAHCPFLAPSLRAGLTTWTVYRAEGDAEAVEAGSSTRACGPRSGCGLCCPGHMASCDARTSSCSATFPTQDIVTSWRGRTGS